MFVICFTSEPSSFIEYRSSYETRFEVKIMRPAFGLGGTAVAFGAEVGGGPAGVSVACTTGTGVAVGGTLVGVSVAGAVVAVAVGGTAVAVGGTAVAVGGTAVAVGGTSVAVAGTGVALATAAVVAGAAGALVAGAAAPLSHAASISPNSTNKTMNFFVFIAPP